MSQLAAAVKQALLPELAHSLRSEILAGVQKVSSLDSKGEDLASSASLAAAGGEVTGEQSAVVAKRPSGASSSSGFTGLLAMAAQGDAELKSSKRPAAATTKSKSAAKQVTIDTDESGTELSPPVSPKPKHKRPTSKRVAAEESSEEDDLERERRTERRMLTHARDFRDKAGSVKSYYEGREDSYNSRRNWKESVFLAQLLDELYEEVSGAEEIKAFKSILRRIAALEVVDRTNEWEVADRVQKAWVSETMIHPEDMRYYVRQHRSLQPENKKAAAKKSSGSGPRSDSGSTASPSKSFYNRRFGKGFRSDSKSPARAKSPAGTQLVKASAPGFGRGGAKAK